MVSGTKLQFVPAQHPESVQTNASNFKMIKAPNMSLKKSYRGSDKNSEVDQSQESDFGPFSDARSNSNSDSDSMVESDPPTSDSVVEESESDSMSADFSFSIPRALDYRPDNDADDSGSDSSDSDFVHTQKSSQEWDSSKEDESNEESDEESTEESDDSEGESEDDSKEDVDAPAGGNELPIDSVETDPSESDSAFYDINENSNDRGQKTPARIYKSWHASAKAPVGLENRGVTCYQNAAVQALLHLPALGRFLLDVLKGDFPHIGKSSVTYELAQLFKKLTERKNAMFPARLLRRLDDINPMLDEWQQEDSHEYFMSLLGRLQEDDTPRGEKLRNSVLHDMFGGAVEQKVTCQRCNTVSTTNQDFYDLPVSFSSAESRKHYTLQRSIKDFFTPEMIEPHQSESSPGGLTGGYECENCKRQTKAMKQIAIAEAPEYLTVHIKRFKMDAGVSQKVKDTMAYPMSMSLTNFMKENESNTPLHYKLVSVVVHEGRTVSSGHYIALTRQPNNEWVMYDDETMRKVPESYVKNHSSAYILIYSRLLPRPVAKQNENVGSPKNTAPPLSPKPDAAAAAEKHDGNPASKPATKRAATRATKPASKPAAKMTAAAAAKPAAEEERVKPAKKQAVKKVIPPPCKKSANRKLLAKLYETRAKASTSNAGAKSPASTKVKTRVSPDSIDEIFDASKRRKKN